MKKGLLTGACLFVFSVLVAGNVYAGTRAKITLKIVDDENKPIPKVNVNVGFYDRDVHKGSTDTNGLFTAEGSALLNEAAYRAEKEGYYRSEGVYRFMGGIKNDRCEPWDPVVTVVVRQVVNPIPMYAKRVETQIPVLDKMVGYDLMIGDWIAPYGEGQNADFVFLKNAEPVKAYNDFSANMDLTFSNAKDGLEKSERPNPFKGVAYTWKYIAPKDGYDITKAHMEIGYLTKKGFYEKNDHELSGCYFRIRSVTNEQGQVVQAYYGKMPGFIYFEPRGKKTATIQFTYYLNPTPNDRNLEFDPKKNLFKNLNSTEQVTAP